jgi:homoserine kinase
VNIKQVKVYSPGSIANLGPGFDVFGIALDSLGDFVYLRQIQKPVVEMAIKGIGAEKIPIKPEINSSGAVLLKVMKDYELQNGFRVDIRKGLPSSAGVGSSGASAAATSMAVNELMDLGLSPKQLIELASYGEGAVAGHPHADNVAASLMGGFVMVGEGCDVIRMDAPGIGIVVLVPQIHIPNKTRTARELLPEKVNLADAVKNIGHATRMTAAVALRDPVLFGKSICDSLIEPHRAVMIPHFWDVKEAALRAGAYGCSISGGGPSIFAVGEPVGDIAKAMTKAFKDVPSKIYHTQPTNRGAMVI